MDKYLSIKEIQDVIMQYVVNKKSELALLVNGEWGIGKTYFIDNIIIPKIKENSTRKLKVVKVSLYSIKDSQDLYNSVYLKMLWNCIEKDSQTNIIEKLAYAFGKAYGIIGKRKSGVDVDVKNITFKANLPSIADMVQLANIVTNLEDHVVIFDDMERCKIPSQEVLGIINDFITEKKCKCIIIGNENELSKLRCYQDRELKYLVALNEKIKINNGNQPQDENEYNLEQLKERTDLIFKDNMDYNVVKEKVIGRTIHFMPNLSDIVESVVEEEKYDGIVKDYILSNSKEITELMEITEHFNIRTLIYAFNEFQRILPTIEKSNVEKDSIYNESVKKVLLYMVYAAIKNKMSNEQINRKTEFECISVGRSLHTITAFRFVDKIISYGAMNVDDIETTFKHYVDFVKTNVKNNSDPLFVLMEYYDYEDEQIVEAINILKKKLQEKEYDISLYSKIVASMIEVKNVGFAQDYLDEIIDIMKKNIDEADGEEIIIDVHDRFHFESEDEQKKKEFNSIMLKLRKHLLGKNKEKNISEIDNILKSGEGWGEKLGDYYFLKQNEILKSGSFIKDFDMEELLELLTISKTRDVADFTRTINSVYSFSNIKEFYANDSENLRVLKKGIEKVLFQNLKEKDKNKKIGYTKEYNFKVLNADLDRILKKLK